jgi:hypothetical protein
MKVVEDGQIDLSAYPKGSSISSLVGSGLGHQPWYPSPSLVKLFI